MAAALILDPVVVRALAAVLSVILLVGGWQKLRDPQLFAAAIDNYRLLPESLSPLLARLLPLFEIVAGLLLLSPEHSELGGLLSIALLLLVTAAVVINLLRGHADIDCGCGGLSQQRLSWPLVLRNGLLLGVAVLAMQQDGGRALFWIDYLTVAGATLALLGLYVSANQLMTTAPAAVSLR